MHHCYIWPPPPQDQHCTNLYIFATLQWVLAAERRQLVFYYNKAGTLVQELWRCGQSNTADYLLPDYSPKRYELEYLAVYGHASLGESWLLDYYTCRYAIRILAAFRQLSTHGQKFYAEALYEPIFGQQISILDPPPYIGLFGPSWSELSPYGWIAGGGGSIGPSTFFVTDGQKRDYLSQASQHARGATKNWPHKHHSFIPKIVWCVMTSSWTLYAAKWLTHKCHSSLMPTRHSSIQHTLLHIKSPTSTKLMLFQQTVDSLLSSCLSIHYCWLI